MFNNKLAEIAEPKATELKRRVWCDRTLVKTHAVTFVLGIAFTIIIGLRLASASTTPAEAKTADHAPVTVASTAAPSAEGK